MSRDIKFTLSSTDKKRAPSAAAEAEWMNEVGELRYPVQGMPRQASPDSRVYFIRDGHVVARARYAGAANDSGEVFHSWDGTREPVGGWQIVCRKMQLAQRLHPHKGFQGFRYVTAEELPAFQSCFTARRVKRTIATASQRSAAADRSPRRS
jgi:hypothetical protein